MYSVIVRAADSDDDEFVLLPQVDEYPGASTLFDRLEDAAAVAEHVIGQGLSCKEDENKIVEAKVVAVAEV